MRKIFNRVFAAAICLTMTITMAIPVNASALPQSSLTPESLTSTQTLDPSNLLSLPSLDSSRYTVKDVPSTQESISTLEDVKKLAADKANALISTYGASSVQYALIQNGSIILSDQAGYANKKTKKAPSATTMYGIGSISKMFTTVAVMQLVDQGKIALDQPVTAYIPEFTMKDARYKKITVRMLLNHSSGLMGSTQSNALLFNDNDNTTTSNLLSLLKTQRLKADPGAYSVYCNDGFTLAELVVERVSGMSFTQYLRKYIEEPLSLAYTKTPQDTINKNVLANIYQTPQSDIALPVESINMIGAGGIYSNASDLCRFAKLFMNSGSDDSILSRSSVSKMENKEYERGIWPEGSDSIIGYGLGWDCVDTYPFNQYGIQALSKSGDTVYYHSSLTVLPDQNMAIAVVSSGGSSANNRLMGQEVLLGALKANGTISSIKPNKTFEAPVKTAMPANLSNYSGYYALNSGVLKIDIKDDSMTISSPVFPQSPAQTLVYTGNGKFTQAAGENNTSFSFVKESNGITYLKSDSYASSPALGQIAAFSYEAQKIDSRTISSDIQKAWSQRNGKMYFLTNEKYTSVGYTSLPATSLLTTGSLPGYYQCLTIEDQNNAKPLLEIPGNASRDLLDYHFYKQNNIEYFQAGAYRYIGEESIKSFPIKTKFTSTLSSKGYAKYYKIGSKAAGKTITVRVPSKSAFMVYNKQGNALYNSYISGVKTAKLPKDGYICFVGKGKATFHIQYK